MRIGAVLRDCQRVILILAFVQAEVLVAVLGDVLNEVVIRYGLTK